METQKISISLSRQQFDFIENYQTEHPYRTRSKVISEALYLLQQTQLEACYREAAHETDDAFEITTSDGLEDNEAW